MTRAQQEKTIQEAEEIICKGHTLLTDVQFARKTAGQADDTNGLSRAIGLIADAITILRDNGESR